ncbi:hypothetical protein A9Q99_08495 [Gammaproteobacteria bacterium 45_16_T64]|nr:hypothetical protein A9Q99_08495 [Gammaproteobacteria bacterium 45_16_T64]
MSISGVDSQSGVFAGMSIDSVQDTAEETDQDMFLRLMLAQLENQNPLQPQDGTEFLSQMAQFSTVEGIGNLNKGIDELNGLYRSNQALQATALVGRDVLVSGNTGYLDGGANAISGVIHADGVAATDVIVNIKNERNEIVRQIELNSVTSDDTSFAWNGSDENGNRLPEGNYTMEVTGRVGENVENLRTSMYANVNSVSIVNTNGDMLLNLNGLGQISSNSIQQVR